MLKIIGRGRRRTISLDREVDEPLRRFYKKKHHHNTFGGYVPVFEGFFTALNGRVLLCDGMKFRMSDDCVGNVITKLINGDVNVTPQGVKLAIQPLKAGSSYHGWVEWEIGEIEDSCDHDPDELEFWRQFCNL